MREVVVEHVGGMTRTISVGKKKKQKKKRTDSFKDIICSPRILVRSTDWYCPDYSDTKSWKTTKRGRPHAKRNWQRHTEGPSHRRAKHGKHRRVMYSSARMLNEMGRCIHPSMNQKYLT